MKLEVGKMAVCVKSHPDGVVKEGDIKEILGIRKSKCGCIEVNIGMSHIYPVGKRLFCGRHGSKVITDPCDGIWWLLASRFAPIESISEEQVDELLDTILESKKEGV